MKPNILMVQPMDYDDALKKGVTPMLIQHREFGFFEKVIFLFPFCRNTKTLEIDNNMLLYQHGWKTGNEFFDRFKITKIIGTIKILFKLLFITPFKIKKHNISVVRATDPYLAGLVGIYYAKILGVKLLVSIHADYEQRYILDGRKGMGIPFGSIELQRKIERFVYKRADMIAPIRESIREVIFKFHQEIDKSKFVIFPHGIDFEKFDSSPFIDVYQKFNIAKDKKIVSFAGRFSKENYIYEIVDIATKILNKRNDVVFLLLGGGNEYKSTKNLIHERNLQDNVVLPDFQPLEVVYATRKQSYINLCLMAGFSLIEACASARPVISYDVEWHYELVKNNETGYLLKEHDVDGVVEKIEFLLQNPHIADELGKNASELVRKRHDIRETTKIKQAHYKKLLGLEEANNEFF